MWAAFDVTKWYCGTKILLYYIGVAISHGLGKTGFLPVLVAVWLPHAVAVWACVRVLRRAT